MLYWKDSGRLTAVIAESTEGHLYVDLSLLDKWLFSEDGNTKQMTFEERNRCEADIKNYCLEHNIDLIIQRTGDNGMPCSYSWNGEKL